ncbi:MAG: bi-domain-containing oxidoreductase [Candidatus Aegiribacteria sp.]|nr:bi-domain-containing oxidoreductase [Candidatus Aegiribacteria sp.]
MKILGQKLSDGLVTVFDAPDPVIADGFVRIRTFYSAISPGTEGGKVITGKKSLIGKAKAKPAQAMQALQMAKTLGLKNTIIKVKSKLEGAQPLGYSLCGEIIEISNNTGNLKVGNIVACAGGGYANHADEAVIPANLVVKLPKGVSPKNAAYTTIASIALQGVRLAEPTIGETAVVIGLGIIGQLAAQILKANGCRIFGIDLDEDQVKLALESESVDAASVSGKDSTAALISDFTRGRGADITIICAGTTSNHPVELAGEITRKKGRVIVVGAVGMDLPREDYFKKEISFAVSCSYGPGRYDPTYEEGGIDYPYPYVRWTEGRNMEAVLDLMANGSLDPSKLTTHTVPLKDSPSAYEMIATKSEPFCGILIVYPDKERESTGTVSLPESSKKLSKDLIGISMLGPGSFAQTFLLPPLKNDNRVFFSTICTKSGLTASDIGIQKGFRKAVSNIDEMLKDPETDAIVVATRHNTHADAVLKAIKAGKSVFVEKPLCLTKEELKEIAAACNNSNSIVQVGFNRRFSKAAVTAKDFIGNNHPPLTMFYRISAGHIPKEHWTQTSEGGGRILGEVCHFIDLLQYFADANPTRIQAFCISTDDESLEPQDNIVINLTFEDGSVGSIGYFAEGGKALPKERCEITGGGRTAVIDNFNRLELYGSSKKISKFKGKGHAEEIVKFITALKTGNPAISMKSQLATTLASFAVLESLETGEAIDISIGDLLT